MLSDLMLDEVRVYVRTYIHKVCQVDYVHLEANL